MPTPLTADTQQGLIIDPVEVIGQLPTFSEAPGRRFVQFLGSVTSDPAITTSFDGTTLTVQSSACTIPAIASRCGVSSTGSAGRWRLSWVERGWATEHGPWWEFHLSRAQSTPARNVVQLSPIQSVTPVPQEPHDPPVQVHTTDADLSAFASIAEAYAEAVHTGHDCATRLALVLSRLRADVARPSRSTIATDAPHTLKDQTRKVSSDPVLSTPRATHANPPRDTSGTDARNRRKPKRTVPEIVALTAAVTHACNDVALPGITKPHGVVKALENYTDEEIIAAANSFAQQIRAEPDKMQSPFGVFIAQAYDRGEHFNGQSKYSVQNNPTAAPDTKNGWATGASFWRLADGTVIDTLYEQPVPTGQLPKDANITDHPTTTLTPVEPPALPEPVPRPTEEQVANTSKMLRSLRAKIGSSVQDNGSTPVPGNN